MLIAASIVAGLAVLVSTWLYPRRPAAGALVGLAGQVPWAAVIVLTGAWGLAISWAAMTVIHVRNLVIAHRDGKSRADNSMQRIVTLDGIELGTTFEVCGPGQHQISAESKPGPLGRGVQFELTAQEARDYLAFFTRFRRVQRDHPSMN
ncbi:MAG TPA: hypothetical protein VMW52_13660 [Phycisphaerae bacterium]|nr:hypothetical protein [Phycisphaerae bacterium]